jgi:hypothetical protein
MDDDVRIIVRLPSRTFVGSRRELMRKPNIGLLVTSPPKLKIPRPGSEAADKDHVELIRNIWPSHSRRERNIWWVYRPLPELVLGTVIDRVPESWVAKHLEQTLGFTPVDRTSDYKLIFRFKLQRT